MYRDAFRTLVLGKSPDGGRSAADLLPVPRSPDQGESARDPCTRLDEQCSRAGKLKLIIPHKRHSVQKWQLRVTAMRHGLALDTGAIPASWLRLSFWSGDYLRHHEVRGLQDDKDPRKVVRET